MLFQILIALSPIFISAVSSIRNGYTADPHSHPWLLKMVTQDGGRKGRCGANLISVPYLENASDIAITAAHCVRRLVASDHDHEQHDAGETVVDVAKAEAHLWHDIAVLKLNPPLNFSTTIQPIQVPDDREEIPYGADCRIADWGSTILYETRSDGSVKFNLPQCLQEINVDMMPPFCDSLEELIEQRPHGRLLYESLCQHVNRSVDPEVLLYSVANTSSGNIQPGDSGSALMCRRGATTIPKLYGIVAAASRFTGGKQFDFQDVQCSYYTKVSMFISWMQEKIDLLRH